jgi:hypothetical protein
MSEYIFGEFAPDAAKDNANVLTECVNMRYFDGGYDNVKKDILSSSFVGDSVDKILLSGIACYPATFAGGRTVRNAIIWRDATSGLTKFSRGDLSSASGYNFLFEAVSTQTIDSLSKKIASFGENVFVENGTLGSTSSVTSTGAIGFGTPSWHPGAGTPVAITPGSAFAAVKDFFFVALDDRTWGQSILWSGINNSTSFIGGLADNQTFPTGGNVLEIVSGDVFDNIGQENAYIFQERAIRRATFVVDTTFVFTFDVLTDSFGIVGKYAASRLQTAIYFVSQKGIFLLQNRQMVNIGNQKINDYFFNRIDPLALPYTRVFVNNDKEEVWFLGKSTPWDDAAPYYDICLIFTPETGRWRERIGLVCPPVMMFNSHLKMEQAVASIPNFDLASVRYGHYVLESSDDPAEYACIATSPLRSKLGGRVLVNSVYPNVNSNPAQTFLRYATTNKIGDTRTYSAQKTLNSDNKFPIRASGKDVSIKLEFTSSDATPNPVTNCSGIDVDVVQIGQR